MKEGLEVLWLAQLVPGAGTALRRKRSWDSVKLDLSDKPLNWTEQFKKQEVFWQSKDAAWLSPGRVLIGLQQCGVYLDGLLSELSVHCQEGS